MIRLDGEQGGKVHLGGQLHVGHLTRQSMGVEGAGKLGVNPARCITLTLLGQVLLDLLALGTVDITVGPGGRHHGADQQGCTGIQRIALQGIEGLGRLRRARLLGLPILIKLVGQPAEGRCTAHRRHLAAIFADLLVAEQQGHGTGSQAALRHALHLRLAAVAAFVEPTFASAQQLIQHLFHHDSSQLTPHACAEFMNQE